MLISSELILERMRRSLENPCLLVSVAQKYDS